MGLCLHSSVTGRDVTTFNELAITVENEEGDYESNEEMRPCTTEVSKTIKPTFMKVTSINSNTKQLLKLNSLACQVVETEASQRSAVVSQADVELKRDPEYAFFAQYVTDMFQ